MKSPKDYVMLILGLGNVNRCTRSGTEREDRVVGTQIGTKGARSV